MKVRLLNNGVTDFIHATGTRFVNATFCGSNDFSRADHFVNRGGCPAALHAVYRLTRSTHAERDDFPLGKVDQSSSGLYSILMGLSLHFTATSDDILRRLRDDDTLRKRLFESDAWGGLMEMGNGNRIDGWVKLLESGSGGV